MEVAKEYDFEILTNKLLTIIGGQKMVNVIGLGYIGLPTALMMASHGVEVVGTDYNKELVATLNRGEVTFEEKKV